MNQRNLNLLFDLLVLALALLLSLLGILALWRFMSGLFLFVFMVVFGLLFIYGGYFYAMYRVNRENERLRMIKEMSEK